MIHHVPFLSLRSEAPNDQGSAAATKWRRLLPASSTAELWFSANLLFQDRLQRFVVTVLFNW
jgi:hypothetical protein